MIKKILKSRIFLVIITIILTAGTTVFATIIYNANQVGYTPSDSTWSVDTVEQALNDLRTTGGAPKYVFLGNAVWANSGSGTNALTYTCVDDGILVGNGSQNGGATIKINNVEATKIDTSMKWGLIEVTNAKVNNTSRAGEWPSFYKATVKKGDVITVNVPLGAGWNWHDATATIIYGVTE